MKRLSFVLLTLLLVLGFAAPKANAEAGYNGGFFIENADKTFNLKLNGRMQPRFQYNQATGDPKSITFWMRRAVFQSTATIHEKVSAGMKLLYSTPSVTLQELVQDVSGPVTVKPSNQKFSAANIVDAYVAYEASPAFIVTAGLLAGLPLDLGGVSSKGYILNEAPITTTQEDGSEKITPLRPSFGSPGGMGLEFNGDVGKFNYDVAVINGTESDYKRNPDLHMSYGAKFAYNILGSFSGTLFDMAYSETPQLTVSVGTNYHGRQTDPNTQARIKYLWTSSAGIGFKYKGFSATSDGYYRKTKISDLGTAVWARPVLSDVGYCISLGYFVIPKTFEVALQGGQIVRQGPDNDAWQIGGGLNYYVYQNNFKVQLDYRVTVDFDDISGTQSKKLHEVALMSSVFF